MEHWNIGDVTISCIVETELPVPYHDKYPFMLEATPRALQEIPWLYPNYVDEDGALKLSIQALLVKTPDLTLLVDTCIGNDKPRKLIGNEALHSNFLETLQSLGSPRESIDIVVCTHLHVDHVGWNTMKQRGQWLPTFPNARYLIGREEYDYWSADTSEDQIPVMEDSVTPIFDSGLADLVEMDHIISPELRLLPTPGHTPGHVSVLIESQGQRAIISGDSMHHPCQIAKPDWAVTFDTDKDSAVERRRMLLNDIADQPVLLIGTHFAAPAAGRVVTDGLGFKLITSE
ncbi:MAG: MBL fold metallo-hydrolase [Pseudohongiellaceae bacterium]